MEDSANGSLKASKAANGINGSHKPSLNGHVVGANRKRAMAGPSLFARLFSIVARLMTWYSIFTVLFRCPSSLEACDELAPRICKPYFQLKQVVSPHVEPYYEVYAAPYVDLVRPYYDTLEKNVVAPGWAYATKHGRPLVMQGQAYGQVQWDKSVQPLLVKYQTLAEAQYQETLAPHVKHFSGLAKPYYDIARTNALQTYHEVLLPTFDYIQPYARQGYATASSFTTDVAVPSAIWAWNKTYIFLDGTVWPHLRVVYVENVEPQLVKIGQRLGRHSERKPGQKPSAESPASVGIKASSFTKPAPSVSASSAVTSPSSQPNEDPVPEPEPEPEPSVQQEEAQSGGGAIEQEAPNNDAAPEKPVADAPRVRSDPVPAPDIDSDNESEVRRIAREIVTEDLKDWQERYAKAADESAAEIEDRVEEITKRMVRRSARTTGKALVEQLQATIVSELMTLRRNILTIVGSVAKGSATPEEGQEQVVTVVRQAGMAIKQNAQDVRTWRENYEAEMQASITETADQHFMILDGIRDLALQKIGMKWAWMDGVTYKDWAKFHLLKDRFDEWQEDLKQLIVSHPGLISAQNAGADVEDEAMKLASSAAKELARLKQVAGWKLTANDDTEEFDSELTKQAAEAAEAAKVALTSSASEEPTVPEPSATEITSEAPMSSSEPVPENVSSEVPVSSGSVPSAEIADSETTAAAVESEAASTGSEEAELAAETLSSSESSSVFTSEEAPGTPPVSADSTQATPGFASMSILADSVMEKIVEADEDMSAPTVIESDPELEQLQVELPVEETPVQSTISSVKPAFLGAAAQSVPTRVPVLDDDEFDELAPPVASLARRAYSDMLSRAEQQYSQAISKVSAQIHGTTEPAHEQMFASATSVYNKALSSASSAFDSLIKGTYESGKCEGAIGGGLLNAVPGCGFAQHMVGQIGGISNNAWSRIRTLADERRQQALDWAEKEYESAKIAIGLATPTPSTPAEHVSKALENARHNYYAGIGVAHARYAEFLAAASSAVFALKATPTPTPTDLAGSVSSVASVASKSAASVVSAGLEGAASIADQAAENWEVLVTKISIQIYGAPTPTPWYESAYSAAGDYASSAGQAAADKVSSITSAAGSIASTAPEEASKQYAAVSSIVSELLVGKEQSLVESIFSRLQEAYSMSVESVESIAMDANDAVKAGAQKASTAASEATEAIKEAAAHAKDEL